MKVYKSGLKKYLKFIEKEGKQRSKLLPASINQIYNFLIWLSEGKNPDNTSDDAVKAETSQRYVIGLKVWLCLHKQPLRKVDEEVLKLILKATKRYRLENKRDSVQSSAKEKTLDRRLGSGSNKHKAIFVVAFVVFWGLARLGELVSDKTTKKILIKNDLAKFETQNIYELAIHDAKMPRVGGASLLYYHGSLLYIIMTQGRSLSRSYKLYLKTYGDEIGCETKDFLLLSPKFMICGNSDPEYWIDFLTQFNFDIPASLVLAFEELPYVDYPGENPSLLTYVRDTLYYCLSIEYIESLHHSRHNLETISPDT
ncbi:hypothetical protein DFH28DRAFT_922264 [Melampsora americana]|nr:hypothetical protein DFH28DRAFT_922264 [Melampsora americana]